MSISTAELEPAKVEVAGRAESTASSTGTAAQRESQRLRVDPKLKP
jgi:hypothetical protein